MVVGDDRRGQQVLLQGYLVLAEMEEKGHREGRRE